jgi:hypothetical protein
MPPPKPPAAHLDWVSHLRANVPGDFRVHLHYDDAEQNRIPIFTSENAEGIVAATIGVMDHSQGQPGQPPLATEILVDARGHPTYIANVAATIGFYIIKDGWRVAPGVTFADMVAMYAPELAVKHILFVPPFQWGGGRMTKVALTDRAIYPLLAVPITDGELRLVREHGVDELQARWERQSTDVLDWGRAGVA